MKKALLTLACVMAAVSAFAQGQINFGNRVPGSVEAKITDAAGNGLSGTGFSAQLWAGPAGASESQLVPVPNSLVSFRTGAAAGYITSGAVTVPGIAVGSTGVFQVRAWDNAGGTITSWEAASNKGASALITSAALGGVPASGPPVTPPDLVGLQPFSIPEPSTIALGVLGAAALLFRRRK